MEKKQHMGWTQRGAQMLLHRRCALLNGELGKYTSWSPSSHRRGWPLRHEPPRSFRSRFNCNRQRDQAVVEQKEGTAQSGAVLALRNNSMRICTWGRHCQPVLYSRTQVT